MTPKKQVSPAIRISQGERDASARATHLEAATRKFLVTTNERKQMSTTTNFKRIALVAVAALGMGVLSSVPSQAAVVGTPTVTVTNGTATLGNSDSLGAATILVRYFAENTTDTVGISVTLGTKPSGAAGGSDSILVTALDTSTSTAATSLRGKLDSATAFSTSHGTDSATVDGGSAAVRSAGVIVPGANGSFAAGKFGYFLDTALVRAAGTYTANYIVRIYEANVVSTTKIYSGTFDIVISDGSLAAAGSVAAAGTSTAVMTASGTGSGDDSGVTAVITPTGTAIGLITVTLKTSAGLPARESVTVTTNIGNLGTSTAAAGKSITYIGGTNGVNTIGIFADGTSGTATITVKTTSVTFSNKVVIFTGTTVASIAAVQLGATLGGSSAAVIAAVAKDAAGNQITAAESVYAYSSDLAVINTGATTGTACTYSPTVTAHVCTLSGATDGTATITLRNKSTVALSTVASNTIAMKVNTKSPAKLQMAFDKATYAPGEAAYLRLWAVDAAGNPVSGGSKSAMLATGGITSSAAFGNGSASTDSMIATTLPLNFTTKSANGFASVEPIYMVKVYMPASGGVITATATGGTLFPLAGQVAVTATATVTDNGAAALAAVNALATTVASLRTLITTLTNLVLKIQKKVKA
jgi:hypothetical protein